MTKSTSTKIARACIALTAIAGVTLAGCSKADTSKTAAKATTTAVTTAKTTATSTATETTTTSAASTKLSAANFHLHQAFVKAMPKGKMMTAVFGILENHTDAPVKLVGFTSPDVKAKAYQLHEVVNGVMQEKKGGITIPAHGKHVLKPGGDHLMLMGVMKPIEAGSKISIVLKFADGSMVTIKDIPARSIGAGDESYSSKGTKMDGMKMGSTTSTMTSQKATSDKK